MSERYKILPQGDQGLTFEFGDQFDYQLNRDVRTAAQAFILNPLEGVLDVVVTLRSFTVLFDPLKLMPDQVVQHLQNYKGQGATENQSSRKWMIPCCYDGYDLDNVAREKSLSVDEVIQTHSQKPLDVLMMGFLPGFAYLGVLDDRIRMPRLATPRTKLPAGSVAIADDMSAIYPSESPGGWQLIARCPLPLFDASKKKPTLFQTGDQIFFRPISPEEYDQISKHLEKGSFDLEKEFLQDG